MPRSYNLGARKAAADETRARIVHGARELLLSDDGFKHFTMEAIARQTGVARMTVYYQFESKSGIYEALADDLAARGKIAENLIAAFACDDARKGLAKMIEAFVHFWVSDAPTMRKLHALSELDPESRAGERESRKGEALTQMLARLAKQERIDKATIKRAFEALDAMLTFGAVDVLVRRRKLSERAIVALAREVAEALLGTPLA